VTASGLGCQKVSANMTFDVHVGFDVPGDGLLKNLHVYGDVSNLTDKKPPFINSTDSITTNGALNVWASPIGRLISVGVRKKW
jgi:iron complex outermembrane recepter protein